MEFGGVRHGACLTESEGICLSSTQCTMYTTHSPSHHAGSGVRGTGGIAYSQRSRGNTTACSHGFSPSPGKRHIPAGHSGLLGCQLQSAE